MTRGDPSDVHQQSRQRRADNELIFQSANEGLANAATHVVDSREKSTKPFKFHCECSNTDCHQPIELTLEQFNEIRNDQFDFIVIEGHQMEDIEDTVRKTPKYTVVRKKAELR